MRFVYGETYRGQTVGSIFFKEGKVWIYQKILIAHLFGLTHFLTHIQMILLQEDWQYYALKTR